MSLVARLPQRRDASPIPLCDASTLDGRRFHGPSSVAARTASSVGVWPSEDETHAVVALAESLGHEPGWEDYALCPAVAQKVGEEARLRPFEHTLLALLPHLQAVCHRPRLYLRVVEERLRVSQARRTPVRAIADLVSHPRDWERRTLRGIQPARVLARQVEDDWDLYENRVAARLVDHLLAYLARRLAHLSRIQRMLEERREASDESLSVYWRVRRIMSVWGDSEAAGLGDEVDHTVRLLLRAQRDLEVLTDSPLYRRVPNRAAVPLELRPTNVLLNDSHYRKVAELWRAWLDHGRGREETRAQREERRQREARAWDGFVVHLAVRALCGLAWEGVPTSNATWRLSKPGWAALEIERSPVGVVTLRALDSGAELCLLPLCASFRDVDGAAVEHAVAGWDAAPDVAAREVVVVHVDAPVVTPDPDRGVGWSFGGRATLLACSPWRLDSEERLARVLHGWLARHATPSYPFARPLAGRVPVPPTLASWLQHAGGQLILWRAPDAGERAETERWGRATCTEQERLAQQAKAGKRPFDRSALAAMEDLPALVAEGAEVLAHLQRCPVCGNTGGRLKPHMGKRDDHADATYWVSCDACNTGWGLRRCKSPGCGKRFAALAPELPDALRASAAELSVVDWPDRIVGRDVWAQPCRTEASKHFRCPDCGTCTCGKCGGSTADLAPLA